MTSPTGEPVLASPPRRPAPWWAAYAVAVAACVAGGFLVPSSWWGVAGAGAVFGLMVTLGPWMPASYRAGWTRATVIVTAAAVCAGGAYAFAVPPFGPRPAVAWPLAVLLVGGAFAAATDGMAWGRGGGGVYRKYGHYQDAVRRGERYGRR